MDDMLIVDGYNVLFAWTELEKLAKESSLEHARNKLVEALNNYQGFKGYKVIIVFDAQYVKNRVERGKRVSGLEIVYSGEGQTADMVIERLVNEWADKKRVFVATSDYAEQKIIFGEGAYRMPARELIRELKLVVSEAKYYYSNEPYARNNELGYRLKGPVKEVFDKWRREK